MNGRNSKMLRRLRKDSKSDKRIFGAYNKHDRTIIRADYLERGDDVRTRYTEAKKIAKQELISE